MTTDFATIGFVGLGTMGNPMVANLRKSGQDVLAGDADEETLARAVATLGVRPAANLADLAEASLLILMLPNSRIVESVVGIAENPGSLFNALRPGTVVVDMGSSQPASTRALAEHLHGRGVEVVDAPVSGGPRRAVTGELTVMMGGDAAVVQRVQPALAPLGTQFTHVGPVGSGHALKALNNLLSAVGLVAALEVLTVGKQFGLDPQTILDVINTSTGRNQSTEVKIGQQVLSGEWNVGFSLPLTVKDIGTALDLANDLDIDIPVSAAAVQVCRQALESLEGTNPDQSEVAKYLQQVTGVRLAP